MGSEGWNLKANIEVFGNLAVSSPTLISFLHLTGLKLEIPASLSSLSTSRLLKVAIMPTWKLIRGWLPSAAVVTLQYYVAWCYFTTNPCQQRPAHWTVLKQEEEEETTSTKFSLRRLVLYMAWARKQPSFQGCIRPLLQTKTKQGCIAAAAHKQVGSPTFSPSLLLRLNLRRYSTSAHHQTGRPDHDGTLLPSSLYTIYCTLTGTAHYKQAPLLLLLLVHTAVQFMKNEDESVVPPWDHKQV